MANSGFKRVQTQFIAALGNPKASSGTGAEAWGLWRIDPGPRGVRLSGFGDLKSSRRAPAGWDFNDTDFWIEEHGLIMEAPDVPIVPASAPAPRKFVVTGDREVTTVLTVKPDGAWSLQEGTLYDVTHLPCRSARYTGAAAAFQPSRTDMQQFPVTPGAEMPPLPGCAKQDYAVLFVVAVEA
mmetsp:Transcript_137019/g.292654  ORF Transcript_137019/g.292654 Transcript_137019/m.292654 type:complete len:182 (-) Transcript_137019:53-598(-)